MDITTTQFLPVLEKYFEYLHYEIGDVCHCLFGERRKVPVTTIIDLVQKFVGMIPLVNTNKEDELLAINAIHDKMDAAKVNPREVGIIQTIEDEYEDGYDLFEFVDDTVFTIKYKKLLEILFPDREELYREIYIWHIDTTTKYIERLAKNQLFEYEKKFDEINGEIGHIYPKIGEDLVTDILVANHITIEEQEDYYTYFLELAVMKLLYHQIELLREFTPDDETVGLLSIHFKDNIQNMKIQTGVSKN